MTRYRFAGFVVSPARRLVSRDGLPLPLIPRYFDLLVLLIERRHEAVHRQQIFDAVWTDVVVSDGALSQAVRTLRRLLGDDPRAPRFIRTVSRHGYQFVFPEVTTEPDDAGDPAAMAAAPLEEGAGEPAAVAAPIASAGEDGAAVDEIDSLVERLASTSREDVSARPSTPGVSHGAHDLVDSGAGALSEEDRRDLAERLHVFGTADALARLDGRPGHARVRALLRDTRWEVPGAGGVPLVGVPGGLRAALVLVGLRLRRAGRHAGRRWASASAGAAVAGAFAGAVGGALLLALPSSATPSSAIAVLALVGTVAGAWGGAGIGAGLAGAEVVARSWRGTALAVAGGAGGAAAAGAAHLLVRWTVRDLFGVEVARPGGVFEGLLLGAAAGAGYAWSTPRPFGGGLATPRGRERVRVVVAVTACCALAALLVGVLGRPMVGGMVHEIARASVRSQIALTPIAHLIGEPDVGPWTGMVIGSLEGALFGCGLAVGLTRRPGL